MNGDTNLQVVRHDAGNLGDPRKAGKKGALSRESKVLDDLTSTRQYMNTLAQPAAEYMHKTIQAPEDAHPLGVAAAKDILDRTIGKAPTELRVGPAEENLAIIRELDALEE